MKYFYLLLFCSVFSLSSNDSPIIDADDEKNRLMKEWDVHMSDFVPDDIITFELQSRGRDEYLVEILETPTRFRGAWFIASRQGKDMNFAIFDPSGNLIVERKAKSEALFHFEAEIPGIYYIKFKNTKYMRNHVVTLAYSYSKDKEQALTSDHLTPMEMEISTMTRKIKEFQVEQQFANKRQESFYEMVASSTRDMYILSIFECMGVIGLAAFQASYIKKLLSSRRVF